MREETRRVAGSRKAHEEKEEKEEKEEEEE